MPAPTTSSEFVDLVLKSGVVEESRVREYLKQLAESSTGIPTEPARLAGLMVHDGLLTYFQAEQILQGKYKRFTIGKYKVLEKLGSGGMGQVFLCEHMLMRRRVAIKVLPTTKAQDPAGLERFYREARAIAAVDHPNLVRAYDIDQAENLHFLVMEYVDGVSLQELVKKVGPLPVLRACHYIYGAAVGLQHVHEIGLVHRDIKPGNILVDRHGMIKVLDLGLARFFHETDDLTKKYDENILGTADYLSPEQAVDSHTVDIRADIYSLGATFYYILTGQPPFPEGTVTQKLIWHQMREPKPITQFRSDVPPEIIAIINRMMKKDAAQRYQTPAELMHDLAPYVAVPIPPPSEEELPSLSRAAVGGIRPQLSAGPITPITAVPLTPSNEISSVSSLPTIAVPPNTPPPLTPPPSHSPQDAALVPPMPTSLVTAISSAPQASTTPVSMSMPAAPNLAWEELVQEPETTSTTALDTATPPTPKSRSRLPQRSQAPAYRLTIVLTTLGLLIIASTVFLLRDTIFPPTQNISHKSNEPVDEASSSTRTWTVANESEAKGQTVRSLREALAKAGPGDTIVIRSAKLSEPPLRLYSTRHRNLTIRGEAVGNSWPIWEATGVDPMLEISSVVGVRLQNLIFDGAQQATNAIKISGLVPGTKLEQLILQRCSLAALRCQNVAGSEQQPLELRQLRCLLDKPDQIGIHITAINAITQHVYLDDCRIEGQNQAKGIQIEGGSLGLKITRGRFFQLATALRVGALPKRNAGQGIFENNVVVRCAQGLVFDRQPTDKEPNKQAVAKYDWRIQGNYFAEVREIGKSEGGAGPLDGLRVENNYRAAGCGEGNMGWRIVERTPAPQLPLDPDNDSTFLRLPK